jgi:hypothetical protein
VNHSTTEAYAARRTFSGTSADDMSDGIEIYKDPAQAKQADELDKQRYS